jgi:hypothetical protein
VVAQFSGSDALRRICEIERQYRRQSRKPNPPG